ncbi:hypothetical protein EGT50_16725 [Rhodococcus xishaensis]|uniref:Uncharacterized protein n=1 Tax=Rhodococcus xishaensis TaxID=2487364 RepID=A0A3S3DX95_9NOCA|nr:hypothetical protein EGT50_16725 [Rhodococcus xishaensis]
MAAPLLAAVFAAPANAAPEDVTLSADVTGNDVLVTVANESRLPILCYWEVADDANPADFIPPIVLTIVEPGGEDRTRAGYDEGNYHISWGCTNLLESWGTGEFGRKTVESFPFTTPVRTGDGTASGSLGSLDSGSLESVDFGSGDSGSVDFGSGDSGSVDFGSGDSGSVEFGSGDSGSLGSLEFGSGEFGSLGSLEFGSGEYGSLASLDYGSGDSGSLASLDYGSLEGVLGFS